MNLIGVAQTSPLQDAGDGGRVMNNQHPVSDEKEKPHA